MKVAARTDPNQAGIVKVLRGRLATVQTLGQVGDGAPDLLVGYRWVNVLAEVKRPLGPQGGCSEKGQKLNEDQERWHTRWTGQVEIVRTEAEALAILDRVDGFWSDLLELLRLRSTQRSASTG